MAYVPLRINCSACYHLACEQHHVRLDSRAPLAVGEFDSQLASRNSVIITKVVFKINGADPGFLVIGRTHCPGLNLVP